MNGSALLDADHWWFHGLKAKKKDLSMFISGCFNTVSNRRTLFCLLL